MSNFVFVITIISVLLSNRDALVRQIPPLLTRETQLDASPLPEPSPIVLPSPSPTGLSPAPVLVPTSEPTLKPSLPSPSVSSQPNPQAKVDLILELVGVSRMRKDYSGASDPGNFMVDNYVRKYQKMSDPAIETHEQMVTAKVKNDSESSNPVTFQVLYDGVVIATQTKNDLGPGESFPLLITPLPRHDLGTHTLQVKINPAKKPAERNYDNNSFSFSYEVLEKYP